MTCTTNNLIAQPALCLALLLAAGCKDPAESVPAAQVAVQAQSKVPEAGGPDEGTTPGSRSFELTPENTVIHFVGSKVTGSHEGGFRSLSGELTLGENLSASRATITIDMPSVYTDSEKLTRHLRSPDFFDVEKFPSATFSITTIERTSSTGGTHTLSGDLTLHGVTRSIHFPATLSTANGGVTASAEFSINRKDFGIAYPGMKDDLIRDGVVIKLKVNAATQPGRRPN